MGLVGNVQPRWKPFNYAVACKFKPAYHRFILSTIFFNIIPLIYFALALYLLKKPDNCLTTLLDYFKLSFQCFLPSFAMFSFYRFLDVHNRMAA